MARPWEMQRRLGKDQALPSLPMFSLQMLSSSNFKSSPRWGYSRSGNRERVLQRRLALADPTREFLR
jgi:hypothetical protein